MKISELPKLNTQSSLSIGLVICDTYDAVCSIVFEIGIDAVLFNEIKLMRNVAGWRSGYN